MEIWCLAPYLPGVQAVCPQGPSALLLFRRLSLSGSTTLWGEQMFYASLAELNRRNKYLAVNKTLNPGLSVAHPTWYSPSLGWPDHQRPDHLWTTKGIQLASFWPPPHLMELFTLNCMSFCHLHWLSSNSVEKKGLKDLALTVFTLRLLKYIARYVPHVNFKSFSLYLWNISNIQKVIDLKVSWKVYFFLYLSHFWKRNRML